MTDKFDKSSLNIIKVKTDYFNYNKLLKENSKILKFYSKERKESEIKIVMQK